MKHCWPLQFSVHRWKYYFFPLLFKNIDPIDIDQNVKRPMDTIPESERTNLLVRKVYGTRQTLFLSFDGCKQCLITAPPLTSIVSVAHQKHCWRKCLVLWMPWWQVSLDEWAHWRTSERKATGTNRRSGGQALGPSWPSVAAFTLSSRRRAEWGRILILNIAGSGR